MLLGYETYISSCIYRNSVFLDIAIKYTTFWYNVNILSRFCFSLAAAAAAKSLQSCLTLCNPIDSSSQGSPIPGILQARTLEWVAISFSNAWKQKLSHVWLFVTPSTAAYQAPPSMGISRQEYWSGLPYGTKYLPPTHIHKCTGKTDWGSLNKVSALYQYQ